MIPEKCLSSFIESTTALSLEKKSSEELQSFIARSFEYHASSSTEVQSAFRELRTLFSSGTMQRWPQLNQNIIELENSAIEQVAPRAQSKIHTTVSPIWSKNTGSIQAAIGPEENIDVLCHAFDPHQCAFVNALKECNLFCRQIKGDGHCAFRAIVIWLLAICSPEEIQAFLKVASEEIRSNQALLRQLPVEKAIHGATSAFQAFSKTGTVSNDQSDTLVRFLRIAAVAHVVQSIQQGTLVLDNEPTERYITRMVAMEGRPEGHGSELEIFALMEMLKTRYSIINFTAAIDPTGFAAKHVTTYLACGESSYLSAAIRECQKLQLDSFKQMIDNSLRARSPSEAKEKAAQVLARLNEYSQTARRKQIEQTRREIQRLDSKALILAYLGNGHYNILFKRDSDTKSTMPTSPATNQSVNIPQPLTDTEKELNELLTMRNELEQNSSSKEVSDIIDERIQTLLSHENSHKRVHHP